MKKKGIRPLELVEINIIIQRQRPLKLNLLQGNKRATVFLCPAGANPENFGGGAVLN